MIDPDVRRAVRELEETPTWSNWLALAAVEARVGDRSRKRWTERLPRIELLRRRRERLLVLRAELTIAPAGAYDRAQELVERTRRELVWLELRLSRQARRFRPAVPEEGSPGEALRCLREGRLEATEPVFAPRTIGGMTICAGCSHSFHRSGACTGWELSQQRDGMGQRLFERCVCAVGPPAYSAEDEP